MAALRPRHDPGVDLRGSLGARDRRGASWRAGAHARHDRGRPPRRSGASSRMTTIPGRCSTAMRSTDAAMTARRTARCHPSNRVEYLGQRPEISRMVGMRRRLFPSSVGMLVLFPLVGAGLVLGSLDARAATCTCSGAEGPSGAKSEPRGRAATSQARRWSTSASPTASPASRARRRRWRTVSTGAGRKRARARGRDHPW